jgi:hypothetical protein
MMHQFKIDQTKGHMDDGSIFDGEHFIISPNIQRGQGMMINL